MTYASNPTPNYHYSQAHSDSKCINQHSELCKQDSLMSQIPRLAPPNSPEQTTRPKIAEITIQIINPCNKKSTKNEKQRKHHLEWREIHAIQLHEQTEQYLKAFTRSQWGQPAGRITTSSSHYRFEPRQIWPDLDEPQWNERSRERERGGGAYRKGSKRLKGEATRWPSPAGRAEEIAAAESPEPGGRGCFDSPTVPSSSLLFFSFFFLISFTFLVKYLYCLIIITKLAYWCPNGRARPTARQWWEII